MALTSIGQQKTPGRPIEITFAAETGLPSDSQEVLLIGHAASGATGLNTIIKIDNSGDLAAASAEAETKFGAGSEAARMVIAAVKANAGQSTLPALKVCPLDSGETSIPVPAQNAIMAVKAEFVVSPYDLDADTASRDILKTMALSMSGAQRTDNNQFGTFGLGANMAVQSPSALFMFDTQFLIGIWFRDTGTGPDLSTYTVAEVAAAAAARLAGNGIPFNPVNDLTLGSVPTPKKTDDWITVGAGLESEAALQQGWTPLRTKPNGEVAFVRSVTGRISADGTGAPVVGAYYDVQDFQVLYFFRKTLWTTFSQPTWKRRKASQSAAVQLKGELIRLAQQFETQNMFQFVNELAKFFQVERNASDRSRFDFKTPVNVIPGLHVIAGNIEATTMFDTLVI